MSSDLQKANKLYREEKYDQAVKIYKKLKKDNDLPLSCYEYNLEKCIKLIARSQKSKDTFIGTKQEKDIEIKKPRAQKNRNRCDINSFNNGVLTGWAINYQSPEKPVRILVFINSKLDGSVLCNTHRKDLELNGIGDGQGRYGFSYKITSNYDENSSLNISCRLDDGQDFDSGRASLNIDRNEIMKSNLASYCDDIRRIYQKNIFKDFKILMSNLSKPGNHIKQTAKVSIIMPTYNRKDIILKAIDSIISQSYKNWELLICDDGSTDETHQHVNQHTSDKRIRYLTLNHSGVSEARNAGLKASTGDFIAFLDSDNTWHSQFLYTMLSYINAGDLDAAYCQIAIKGKDEVVKGYRGDIFSWQSCLKKNYIDMNCFVHKANSLALQDNIMTNELFDTNLKRLVDWDYILRVTRDINVSFCPLPLVSYYDGDDFERITKTVYTQGDIIQDFIKSIQSKHYSDMNRENLDKLVFLDVVDQLPKIEDQNIDSKPKLYYFPDYTSTNSYQDLFYGSLRSNFTINACDIDKLISLEISNIEKLDNPHSPKIFHIHWHNAFFNNKETTESMRSKVYATIKKIEFIKKLGFKIIWTLHNIKSHESRHELHEIELIKKIIDLAEHIIIHDLSTIDLVKPWYSLPLSKVIVCPHAGYQSSIKIKQQPLKTNQLKKKYSLPENSLIFAAIGQIRAYKNLDYLVEVFLRIAEDVENIYLFIAGKPVHCDTTFLENAAKQNPRIILELGFISDENLFCYMQDIDCLILNYSNVLTSGSYHLAETVGCPVICPDQGLLSKHIHSCDAVFGFGSGSNTLENAIYKFIDAYESKGLELSKIILAKSSEVSWKLAADTLLLNLHLSPKFQNINTNYSNISHSWFVNLSYQSYKKNCKTLAIVVHYSNIDDTLGLVNTLKNQTEQVDIVIICNSESSNDFQLLTLSLHDIPIAQNQSNGGYAVGVNLGLHLSIKYDYDYFWILNPDLEMGLDTAQRFQSTLVANKEINIIGCTLTGYGEAGSGKVKFCGGEVDRTSQNIGTKHMFDGVKTENLPDSLFQCDYLTGANIFGKVAVLDDLGFLPEDLFLYFEETIWLLRYIQKTGDKPWVLPDLLIKNKKRSENSLLPTKYYFYYMIRNWLIFAIEICGSEDYSKKMPESIKFFISTWLNKIKSKKPEAINNYINIASCAYEHGLIKKTGINADIDYFSRDWIIKFGVHKLIAELLIA